MEAVTHGPVARLVVVCKVKFVPAEAGQRTMICPPEVPTDNGGKFVSVTKSESGWLNAPPRLSVTCAVKLNAPFVAMVPEITPLADRFKLAGRLPDASDQLMILLLWSLPVTALLLGLVWLRRQRSRRDNRNEEAPR